jgi:hypothetical protein
MNSMTHSPFGRAAQLVVLFLLSGLFSPFADDRTGPAKTTGPSEEASELQRIRDSIAQLCGENAKPKEDIAQLRKESQQLRRLLAQKGEPSGATGASSNAVGGAATNHSRAAAEIQLTHWFTLSKGKRHNSQCRYFKTTEGQLCGPDGGKPSKLCGG